MYVFGCVHVPFILTIGSRRRKWILPLSISCPYSYINKNVRKFSTKLPILHFKTAYAFCPFHSCSGLSCPSRLSSLCCPVLTSSTLSCLLPPCPVNINGVLRVRCPCTVLCFVLTRFVLPCPTQPCPAMSSRLSHFQISSSLESSFQPVLYAPVH